MARTGISTKNTEKIPPGPNSGTPRKYPQNTPKMTKLRIFGILGGIFWVFSGYFGGKFWESRISGRVFFFSVFFVEIPGRATSGLCSRSGRSQKKPFLRVRVQFRLWRVPTYILKAVIVLGGCFCNKGGIPKKGVTLGL